MSKAPWVCPGPLTSLPFAGILAFLAGVTDVYGLHRLDGVFVSFMSGNTTSLGIALGDADWSRAELIGGIIGLFVIGAFSGAVIGEIAGRHHAPAVVTAVAVLLVLPILVPSLTVATMVTAMGALNAAMTRIGAVGISLTYVTGTLVKFGQGLGRALCGKPADWSWGWQAAMWTCLLAGAVSATLVQQAIGPALWPVAILGVGIAIVMLVDPTRQHTLTE